jgi:hypothetical protein
MDEQLLDFGPPQFASQNANKVCSNCGNGPNVEDASALGGDRDSNFDNLRGSH